MLICARCGYYNSDVATRCEQCGRRLSPTDAEPAHHTRPSRAPETGASDAPSTLEAPDSLEAPDNAPAPIDPRTVQYGGFWVRFLATMIDGVVIGFGTVFLTPLIAIFGVLFLLLVPAFYEVVMETRTGATLGKKVFKLRVVRAGTYEPIGVQRSIVRYLAHFVSTIFFIGFIMAAIDGQSAHYTIA